MNLVGIYDLISQIGKDIPDIIKAIRERLEKKFRTVDGKIEFTPFNISIVAPSGFGKTTLLVTIMNEASNKLDDPTKGLSVGYEDKSDEKRITDAQKKLHSDIMTKEFTGKVNPTLSGTSDVKKFDFYFRLTNNLPNNKQEPIDQPFSIMDIPGGWINSKNRITEEMNAKWREFKEHLQASRLLFVPIDAPLIMEPTSQDEVKTAVKLLDCYSTGELVKEWAKYRKGKKKSSVLVFVPIKCEKYRDREKELKDMVYRYYGNISNTVREILGNIEQYYIPLETLGCVELARTEWNTAEGQESFTPTFKICGDEVMKPKNVDILCTSMYRMAGEEIEEVLEELPLENSTPSSEKKDKKDKKKEKYINELKNELKKAFNPIIQSLKNYGDKNQLKKYEINW